MTAAPTGLHALAQGVILSPFTRIRRLLEGIEPGMAPPIEMMVGEPREVMPGFVTDDNIAYLRTKRDRMGHDLTGVAQ